MAVRGLIWWEYWETRSGTGEQYGGSIGGHLAVLGYPPDPLNNSGGGTGASLGPINKLEG